MPKFKIEDFDTQMEAIRARRKQKPATDLLSRLRQAAQMRLPKLPSEFEHRMKFKFPSYEEIEQLPMESLSQISNQMLGAFGREHLAVKSFNRNSPDEVRDFIKSNYDRFIRTIPFEQLRNVQPQWRSPTGEPEPIPPVKPIEEKLPDELRLLLQQNPDVKLPPLGTYGWETAEIQLDWLKRHIADKEANKRFGKVRPLKFHP